MTYTTPRIEWIWSDEVTLWLWQQIELATLKHQVKTGKARQQWLDAMINNMWTLDNTPIDEWKKATEQEGHEVVAFLQLWHSYGVKHCHIGLTSSDLTDTALGWRVKMTGQTIENGLLDLAAAIDDWSEPYQDVSRLARTHGQPAVVSTFGHLTGTWGAAIERAAARISHSTSQAALAKISGPVGTYMHIGFGTEVDVAFSLGLQPASGCTQIIARDRLAAWANDLAVAATIMESIAIELRLLMHSGIDEVYISRGSVTSSAMPHKTNPTRLERVTGLARIARAAVEPITAGIVQWHDRDMAHSSVERILLPQLAGAVQYIASELFNTLPTLKIDGTRARANINEHLGATWTHSMQTHLQNGGMTYLEAREHVKYLYDTNLLTDKLRVAIRNDPKLLGFQFPTQ